MLALPLHICLAVIVLPQLSNFERGPHEMQDSSKGLTPSQRVHRKEIDQTSGTGVVRPGSTPLSPSVLA